MRVRMRSWLVVLTVSVMCVSFGSGCRLFQKKKTPPPGPTTIDLPMGEGEIGGPGSLPQDRPGEDGRLTGPEYTFDPVYFAYDSFKLESAELAKIDRVAQKLRSATALRLVTEGHCDERGSREYNMPLGEHRALAVRASLISAGVDGSRLQTRSYGEEQPAVEGHEESAWRMNRRVEFAFYNE